MIYLKPFQANLSFFLVFFLFCFAAQAQEQISSTAQLDIPNLIRETARGKQGDALTNYSYKFGVIFREIDKTGRVKTTESKVYETFLPSNLPRKEVNLPMILLEKNGQMLDTEELELQRKKAGAQLETIERQAEKDSAKPITAPPDSNDYLITRFNNGSLFHGKTFSINIRQILQGAVFTNPRAEILDGRETILLDFTPRPDFVFGDEMRYFSQIKGKVWIDTADKHFVKLEGYPITSSPLLASDEAIRLPMAVVYEQIRVPEGFWFFRHAELNAARYPNIFGKSSFTYEMNQSDYKRFRSEVKTEDAPNKP